MNELDGQAIFMPNYSWSYKYDDTYSDKEIKRTKKNEITVINKSFSKDDTSVVIHLTRLFEKKRKNLLIFPFFLL